MTTREKELDAALVVSSNVDPAGRATVQIYSVARDLHVEISHATGRATLNRSRYDRLLRTEEYY